MTRASGAGELHGAVAARLRPTGQRHTASRRALVDALATADGPLALAEVQARCDDLPQSSAYRNLALLERVGVVHRIASSDEFSRFEIAEELSGHHHHHLICESCGRVADFTVPPTLEAALDDVLSEAAGAAGFDADHHRLDLIGRCARCR